MPLSTLQRIPLDKAAIDEGFGLKRPDGGDWLVYEGLGTPCTLRLTCRDAGFLVALNHSGAAADLLTRWPICASTEVPDLPAGFTAFRVNDTAPLHQLVAEIRRLARALPTEPLRQYEIATKTPPRTTEAERLVVQRVGQNIFREALLSYWGADAP